MVIAPGEVEQPEPIADGERVKIQRVPLASVRAIPCLVCHRLVPYSESSTAADRGQHNAMRGQRHCRETETGDIGRSVLWSRNSRQKAERTCGYYERMALTGAAQPQSGSVHVEEEVGGQDALETRP